MKDRFVLLKIKDTEDAEVLDAFLVKNPTQKSIEGLQDLVDRRYEEDYEDDWDYCEIYEYVENNFEIVGYDEETIDY